MLGVEDFINETIEELKANGKLAALTVQFTEEAD